MTNNNNNNNNNNIPKGGADELEKFVMENCLMLFKTQVANAAAATAHAANATPGLPDDDISRAFTCKTCGKKFHSFQALGGHRASHKKLKPAVSNESLLPAKPKTHACTICGAEFPTGQALGGHMRRHRPVVVADVSTVTATTTNTTEVSVGDNQVKKRKIEEEVRPVLKRSSSNSKRVCLDFNLSFAPWVMDIEEGEIIEKQDEEDEDFLKLELRQPIRN